MCSDPVLPVSLSFATAFADEDAVVTDVLELPFDMRERSRLRARLLSGQEIGIDLPVGTILHHGSKLRLDDGRVVGIEASDEQLLQVPIQVGDGWLRILPDHVLEAMVEGLGGQVRAVTSRFQPESGAYGHSHVHHHHDDQGHGGRIHIMDPARS
jgi:urease accessory protein